uniref:Gag protein, putative n=1 Tax=Brugia malayi TaxID=6279 RepID=A8P799_BRUMA
MSATVVLSARLAEEKLEAFLKEVQEMDLTLLEQMLTEQMLTCQQDSLKKKNNASQGGALLAVRGYDITSENYDVIRKVLIEKFGQSHIIKKSLYNESYSVKKNDRQWKITVEATERILRQLEAMDENLEQSSTGITTENKLLAWFLDRV